MYVLSQYAHDVVLTSMQRRFKVMDVVWTSKRRRVAYGDTFTRLAVETFFESRMINPKYLTVANVPEKKVRKNSTKLKFVTIDRSNI